LRFVRDTFSPEQTQTLGAAYMVQTVILGSSIIKLEIWDTAGQEQYHGIVPLYYRNAKAALVVYDVTSRASFEQANFWIKNITEEVRTGPIVMILVGNKTDLITSRCITAEEGEALAKKLNILFMETSAKTNTNVSELFIKLAQNLKNSPAPVQKSDLVSPMSGAQSSEEKKCCG
jgi:small GTP-binding protein